MGIPFVSFAGSRIDWDIIDTYQVMNAAAYGNVLQDRERIDMAAFRKHEDFLRFQWPLPVPLKTTVRNMIDFDGQGFPSGFVLPDNQSDARLYKQAGNSVCVPVIWRVAESIGQALDGVRCG